ncbi:MAG: decaprenyl-phosphate phosphoribosyltransferase [Actinomycetota bacterium]|nr:decaprenyl-phosphate phosphoribosyltransferase [Actinomycetota bacterium]
MAVAVTVGTPLRALLAEARPKQWAKNVLVFAAPGAAGVLDDPQELGLTVIAFIAMCLVASGTYYWNDLFDLEADRVHPDKKRRPIASGRIPVPLARTVGTILLLSGCGVAALTGRWQTVVVVAFYAVLTLSYTIVWKHVAVLDLVVVASGFVLRAVAGAVAVDVPMSDWFVLVTTFGSLFIVAGKRYAELHDLGDGATLTRTTLGEYSLQYLRMVVSVACGGTLLSYCMWAFERHEQTGSDLPLYQLTIVPMLAALLRYLLVLDRGDGHGAAPEDVFSDDRVLQLLGVTWIVIFGVAVYM